MRVNELTLLQRCTGLLTAQTALKHLSHSQFWVQYPAQRYFNMQPREAGNRTSNLPVSGRPALPPELQSIIINIEVTPTLDKEGIFSKAFCYRVDLNLPSWNCLYKDKISIRLQKVWESVGPQIRNVQLPVCSCITTCWWCNFNNRIKQHHVHCGGVQIFSRLLILCTLKLKVNWTETPGRKSQNRRQRSSSVM